MERSNYRSILNPKTTFEKQIIDRLIDAQVQVVEKKLPLIDYNKTDPNFYFLNLQGQ